MGVLLLRLPNTESTFRSKCLCVGAFAFWLETNTCTSSHQSSGYICALVTIRKKFAVGSGARVIAVCYFEEENDWWVSKQLKKPIRSTVTCLAWHPNSVLLAAGSTDSHARVFSGFIKGIDERPESTVWGERLPFNTVCGEYLNDSAGWIHNVAFSPSGDVVAFVAHDSSITIVYPSAPEQPPKAMINVSTQMLPFTTLIWNGESEIIAAGHVSYSSICDFGMRLQGLR